MCQITGVSAQATLHSVHQTQESLAWCSSQPHQDICRSKRLGSSLPKAVSLSGQQNSISWAKLAHSCDMQAMIVKL